MDLTFAQIKELTVGALTVTETEQGITFTRFTPEQVTAFPTEKQRKRTAQTAGIRVDFHTDADRVEVTVAAAGKYEILVDDLCTEFELLEAGETVSADLPAGDHRVTVMMPSHFPGALQGIRLMGETYVKPHVYRKKAAFYGDSITQGWKSEKDSQSFAWLLTRHFDLHSMNFGVGGSKFQPETVVDIGYEPDVVLVALGTNNFNPKFSLEYMHENCGDYLDRILNLYPDSKLFCITPIWRGAEHEVRGELTFPSLRKLIADEAEKRNIAVIDGYEMVPHRAEYYADEVCLHPNDMGFANYARKLIKILTPYL